jgi:putative ABC transport system permease protein
MQWLWALGLVALALALSALQGLALEGSIILAVGRAVLQLAVLGYALAAALVIPSGLGVLGLLAVLGAVALELARRRISLKLPGLRLTLAIPMAVAVITVVSYTLLLVVQEPPWSAPRYALPLGAMVLASSASSAAIAGDHLVSQLNASRSDIETRLSLGATPEQALSSARLNACRTALVPHISAMAVVGLGSLPSWTAGQLLGGMSPFEAVTYELLLLVAQLVAMLITVGWVSRSIIRQFFSPGGEFITW